MKRSLVVLAVVTSCGVGLSAHDIALFPEIAGINLALSVRYGHPGNYTDTAAGKLVSLDLRDPAGESRSLVGRMRPDGGVLTMTPLEMDPSRSGVWILSAFYDNGFSLRTPGGRSVNTTLAEFPGAEVSHNLKFGKALVRTGNSRGGFDAVLGHRIEIVPQADPFAVKPGGSLSVQVRFHGKPLANATVRIYASETSAEAVERTTNASGIAEMPVARNGRQIISIEHGVPSRHPDVATRDGYAASLVFSLP